MNRYENQKSEIETITERTITIKLSDADVERVSKLAGEHGITVETLLENFIGDLVGGTYSNGSDERAFARRWFERCWFGMFPENTFLHFLISWGYIDDALETADAIAEHENTIKEIREALASGVMKRWNGETYVWNELVCNSCEGERPAYNSKEEWEKEELEELQFEEIELFVCQEQLVDYWREYLRIEKNYKHGTYEKEWAKVREWNEHYLSFIAKNNLAEIH